MAIKTKHHNPLVYRVYDYMKDFVGEDNAVPGQDLAAQFNITPRHLRFVISKIRTSDELTRIILSSDKGYFMATEEEFDRHNKRLECQAYSLLKVSYANRKKAAKDGQYKLPFGEYYQDFVHAFGE